MIGDETARDAVMPYFNPRFAAYLWGRLRQAGENYQAHGRRFATLDGEALRQRFVLAHKPWSAYPDHTDTGREVNDVSAEYLLRRQDAPVELIAEEVGVTFIGSGWHSRREMPKALAETPVITIAVGRMLFAPFLGALLTSSRARMPVSKMPTRSCRISAEAWHQLQIEILTKCPGYKSQSRLLPVRHVTAHLGRRLVLAQSLTDDLPQQIVIGPSEELHVGDQLGPDPMHAAENQRRAEAAAARRRCVKRHLGCGERLKPAPQPLQFRLRDAGAGAAGIDQPAARIVIREQQGAEIRPPSLRARSSRPRQTPRG